MDSLHLEETGKSARTALAPHSDVTVGMCVRNGAFTLREAVASIMFQDFRHENMEIVFVDDGSDDETYSIIQEYTSKIDIPVKIIRTSWKGLGHARNLVVANASGRYILWLDCDMIISKDFIKKLVQFVEQNPEVAIAKGFHSLEGETNLLGMLELYSRSTGRMVDRESEKARLKSLGTGGSIYRVDAIKQVGGFDESMRHYGEDWDIEIRIRRAGWSLRTVDTTFSDYERHGLTWQNLWKRYWLRGYFTHYFLHKNKGLITHYRMFPPAAVLAGILHSRKLFKSTGRKFVFLLPLQYFFKFTAWYIGYTRSHVDSYQPKLK